jgi:16S rRNA (guanine527-N7)-methyltransferase
VIHREAEKTALFHGASDLGVSLDDGSAERLLDYLDLLYVWNRSAGLTAVPRQDAVRLHVLDSLTVLETLEGVGRLADLGSGGGLPGIPIAIMCQETNVTLVETRRRKCSFLREVRRIIGLENCEVLETDADTLAGSVDEFDAVVSRAFRPSARFVATAAKLVRSGGRVIVMSGRDADLGVTSDVLDGLGLARIGQRDFRLPGGPERRHLLVLRRA